jgi:hypothetical protein
VACDYDLTWRIEVGWGDHFTLPSLDANRFDHFAIGAEDRAHGPDAWRDRALHGDASRAHETRGVFERQRFDGHKSGVLSQGMARHERREP